MNDRSDLSAFLAEHGRLYDPATDDYRRPPFAAPVQAGKNTPIYNAHPYHTKVPPQGIVPYIHHYTDPGDIVLDPFCGSGMTGVAALMTGRHAILNDLSPAAVHIAYNYCTPVDVTVLRREFARIRTSVQEEFEWLYGTTCDRCGGPATIQYTIWSDVFECERCRAPLVLWELAVDPQTGKVNNEFTCPSCNARWEKTDLRWLRSAPVVTNYECHGSCRTSRAEHDVTPTEKARISEIDATEIPHWYPTAAFDESWEMWRAAHGEQGITDVSRFFTKRNLWALARLWQEIGYVSAVPVRKRLQFAFTACVTNCSRMYKYRSDRKGGILTGTLYLPALSCEWNVGESFARKMREDLSGQAGTSDVVTIIGSATNLALVPGGAVDYIFTDPPFGSNIFYADCNLIWESWLDRGLTDQSQEAVVHVKHREKNTLPDYARLMTESFEEMYRLLKPGRWASVVFHNSDDRIWQTILDAAEAAGFELAEINAFDKVQLSFKGIRGQKGLERVTNQDIVLNLHKPTPLQPRSTNGAPRSEDLETRVVERIASFLATSPPVEQRTLQYIWNHVLYDLLAGGAVQVSMADVDGMLPYYFKQVDGRWYLRGEAVVGGRGFDLRNESDAIGWLTAILGNNPQTTGDLIPRWQEATFEASAALTKSLDQILEENFWQDRRTGRWRLPTAAERDKMSARHEIADQSRVRQIQRYVAGELDVPPSDVELCGWIQFAYEHELFAEAVQMFANVHEPNVDADLYGRTRKIVRACRMRAGNRPADGQLPLL